MLEMGRDADLAEETFPTQGGRQLGFDDFDGDLAVVFEILRQPNRGHATMTELALDPVVCGQGGLQASYPVVQMSSGEKCGPTLHRPVAAIQSTTVEAVHPLGFRGGLRFAPSP